MISDGRRNFSVPLRPPYVNRLARFGLAAAVTGGWLFTRWQAGTIARTYPPLGSFVDLGDGNQIHYTERRPDAEPRATIVLLHGASGNQADVMLPLGDRLAALGFRVLAPDRPGHGWSQRPDGADGASPAHQAQILRRALETIGVEHAIVLGHSWSGALAVNFGLDHADFTDGLVLLAPVLYPWAGGIAWYYNSVARPWLGPAFTRYVTMPLGLMSLKSAVAQVFAPQAPPPGFAELTGVYLVLRPSEFTANAQDVYHLRDFVTGQAPRMRELSVPTAIVTGDSDTVVNPQLHSVEAAKDIPGVALTVLQDVGHSPHWADPESVVAAIVDVAERTTARRALTAEQVAQEVARLPVARSTAPAGRSAAP